MPWFRRRRSPLNLGTFVAPEPVPEASIDDIVDEAELIAGAGVRLAVKNLLILRSVRDHADYDRDRMAEAVREELLNMADERDRESWRLGELRDEVQVRAGLPRHHDDYRSVDAGVIDKRREVTRLLAGRLRDLSEDRAYVDGIVETAQADAWAEIAASLEQKLLYAAKPMDDKYEEYRDDRLLRLLGDLRDLDEERGGY